MLLELGLRNVAVIEAVTLPLAGGLNVLTGETGAGKSLIVGALGLLLGERAAADRIRAGADRAVVEATFDARERADVRAWLDAHGIHVEEDGLVILKREVSAAGRSRAWVNGSAVTVTVLRELGAQLVAVHGQHEARQLLDPAAQRLVLDAYAGAQDDALRVAEAHERVLQARRALDTLDARRREVEQRADYLRFLVQEIDAASLRPGDDELLDAEHRRLAHAEELRDAAVQAAERLHGEDAVLPQLSAVQRALTTLQRIDPSLERLQPVFDGAYFALDELARELAHYADGVDIDPERLREVDAKRAVLHQLLRKHGPAIDDVLATAARGREELALVDDAADAVRRHAEVLALAERERADSARALSVKRSAAAERLGAAVSALLPELGMADGRFDIRLAPLGEPGPHGAEQVQFLVSLNTGSPAGPLDRVASGGELARVMLALSTVLARLQQVPTLVFDEVDAGVGGAVAWQVGALMRGVAAHHQVLAISHLAQIAACAHHHIVVRKDRAADAGGLTTADTDVVTSDARIVELARMLGGDADREISRAHARELLERGQAVETAARPPRTPAARAGRATQRRGKPV